MSVVPLTCCVRTRPPGFAGFVANLGMVRLATNSGTV